MPDLTAAAVRGLYPVTAHETFLNHAAVGPISTRVIAAMQAQLLRHATDPFRQSQLNAPIYREGRERAARLVGGAPDRIAYIQNTSHGVSLLANGLGLNPGDNVIVPEREFPSNTLPWLRLEAAGVEIRRVAAIAGRMTADAIRPALDARTRVVTLSHVQYWNGHRCDVAGIGGLCRPGGVHLIVDGTQSIGAMPLDMAASGVDAVVVSSHKWMLGPIGIGFLAFSARMLECVAVTTPGWLSVNDPFEFHNTLDFLPDARRHEPGTENGAGICGLTERLREIDDFGLAAIEARILGLNDEIAEAARRLGAEVDRHAPAERSGILTFAFPGRDNAAAVKHLLTAKVRVSLRHGRIRVSPHYYNDATDVAALADGLAGFLKTA
ncbi:MAG TPA: aminotransferase class V-fold PLP-dependent enzyme [Stellaceae bacterium]|nr:aminotransferase class V-fold PLP-dependent enzyme [Stellaceae bacterium]